MKNNDSYRDQIEEIRAKGEDSFEKNFLYISTGALVITVGCIDKLVEFNPKGITLLLCGWTSLILTITINLFSHYLSAYFAEKTIDEMDMNDKKVHKKIMQRNKIMDYTNIVTAILLLAGIILIAVFVAQGAVNYSTDIINKKISNTK